MEWLNVQWITANWVPLLVTLVLGFILGWLLTGLSPRRKNAAYEQQLADLESKARKTERDLSDARKQVDSLKAASASTESTLNDARTKLGAVQGDLQKTTEDKSSLETELQSRNVELADLKMQLALLQDQFDKNKSSAMGESQDFRGNVEELNGQVASLTDQVASLTAERDSVAAELNAVRNNSDSALHSLASKDAALNEAYQRAINLQRALEDRDASLTAAQSELSMTKVDVAALNNVKAELENRLQNARGDVASEMATLTSTMIRMKEEQLTTANARIAELMNELNAAKAAQAAG